METQTKTFNLPKVLRNYWRTKEMAEKKITEASILALVGEHKITASKGAELLGISLWDLIDLAHARGVVIWDDTKEDMEEDLKVLHQFNKIRQKEAESV